MFVSIYSQVERCFSHPKIHRTSRQVIEKDICSVVLSFCVLACEAITRQNVLASEENVLASECKIKFAMSYKTEPMNIYKER